MMKRAYFIGCQPTHAAQCYTRFVFFSNCISLVLKDRLIFVSAMSKPDILSYTAHPMPSSPSAGEGGGGDGKVAPETLAR